MAQCYQNGFEFPRVCRRVVEARFDGGEITSDGGSLLLRQAERKFGADAAGRLAALLAGIEDPERLAVVGEWIIDCASGDELTARLESSA